MSAKSTVLGILFTIIGVIVVLQIKNHYWPSSNEDISQFTPPPTQQPSPKVEAEEESQPQTTNPGWKEVGKKGPYTMYEPDTSSTTTEWFKIEGLNATYESKDCVVRFKKKDGTVVSFKYDSYSGKKYLEMELGSGTFSSVPWDGYDEVGRVATHVRFIKIPDPEATDPFIIRIGITSEPPPNP